MARAASPEAASTGTASASRHGRITVCCRVRPLLESEVNQGVVRAPWSLTDTSVSLRDRHVGRTNIDSREADSLSKTRSELRALDHLRRDESETFMDAVFGGEATTREVYERSFRDIVAGASEGLNGAILAYGQTASGKTYSISGTTASTSRSVDCEDVIPTDKGIIHFALEDLFSQIRAKAAADTEGGGREYLVRMSYCELYMERVNDLLRKISPQSQNLSVKEDADSRSFYVEGIKEKIVSSPEEVTMHLAQAEKRRRVAYTRYNEVSSRSHTLLTLFVECSASLEATEGAPSEDRSDEPRVTKVGRLTIVDLAGNERMEAGTEYMAESNSINKSLFFLGKVIEKLSTRERAERRGEIDDVEARGHEHVPFRDSKLTRLLSVHLGGNSQTGVLVTLTPAEDSIESSISTLRFAQKASTIKCVAKPVLISKEQSLIIKQREIIAQLHQQVRDLKEAQRQQQAAPDATPRQTGTDSEVSAERQQRVEQLQALTFGGPSSSPTGSQAGQIVSKSREVDAIVTALHKSNDTLRKQKATMVDEFRDLHRTVQEVSRDVAGFVSDLKDGCFDQELIHSGLLSNDRAAASSRDGKPARAWEPAVQELRKQLQALLLSASKAASSQSSEEHRSPSQTSSSGTSSGFAAQAASAAPAATSHADPAALADDFNKQLREAKEENAALRRALSTVGGTTEDGLQEANAQLREENARLRAAAAEASTKPSSDAKGGPQRDTERQLREDNSRLRASVKFLSAERERLKLQAEQVRSEGRASSMELPCKRSDGTGKSLQGLGQRTASPSNKHASLGSVDAALDRDRLRSPSGRLLTSPEVSTRPNSGTTAQSLNDFEPIVERGSQNSKRLSCASPIRRLDSSLSEFEPIVEHCNASPHSPASDAPQPPASPSRSAMPPPRPPESRAPAEIAPKLAMDYFRQVGVRTNWHPGDTAYWRGQQCKVVKVVTEDQPLYVVIRTPGGSEVTTDLCLLAECPPSGRVAGLQAVSDGPDNGRPLRLAPLSDLCLDRPPVLDRPSLATAAGADRPPALPETGLSPGRALLEAVGSGDASAANLEKIVGRSASLPARGLSPVKPPARLTASSQGRTRCMSPLPGQLGR